MKIGDQIDFVDHNGIRFRGTVLDVRGEVRFVGVLGYPYTFTVAHRRGQWVKGTAIYGGEPLDFVELDPPTYAFPPVAPKRKKPASGAASGAAANGGEG